MTHQSYDPPAAAPRLRYATLPGPARRPQLRPRYRRALMTRVLLMSDLHIEFGPLTVPQTEVDVAILAGDIHVGSASPAWAEELARQLDAPVVLIAGNHEHYGSLRATDRRPDPPNGAHPPAAAG